MSWPLFELNLRLARHETGLRPPISFTDLSKAALLLWIIYVISILFLLCFRARLFVDALWSPAEKGLTSWLSFMVSNCEVVTSPLVSWVRCGALLYQFLIFALFLTFNTPAGRYLFLRMSFGLSSSPEKTQRNVCQLYENVEGCAVIVDDILVWGSDIEEHNKILRAM